MDMAQSVGRSNGRGDEAGFAIERRSDPDGTARLILRGELDLASKSDLRDALVAEQRAGTAVIVVLDQLDYLDSAGIGELVKASHCARRVGRPFVVTPGTGNVRRVLRISGALSELSGAGRDPAEAETRNRAASGSATETADRGRRPLTTPR
jgi:anti-sigma B factor antagonist